MKARKPKKRNAWLITWECSREDYLKDLQRPRVVAILKPQLVSQTIKKLLPILYTTEKQLTFSEKISHGFTRRPAGWVSEDSQSNSIYCGGNPYLLARLVTDLYVQTYDDALEHQTLYWTEHPWHKVDPNTRHHVEVAPAQQHSEDVRFDILWSGKPFLVEKKD